MFHRECLLVLEAGIMDDLREGVLNESCDSLGMGLERRERLQQIFCYRGGDEILERRV